MCDCRAQLLEERHQIWVNTHENRLENNKIRKVQEDENYERRVLETSSEFRAQQRLQRRMRDQLVCEAQNMQPIVMLSAFTQKMLNLLVLHWSQRRLESHLSRTVRIWRQHRSVKRKNSHAANLLIEWLQKSVTVKSVSFRVFKGLRIFVRRVKRVQGLWRIKQATRKLKFLIIEKAWVELETQYVDAAIEECENMRLGVSLSIAILVLLKNSSHIRPIYSHTSEYLLVGRLISTVLKRSHRKRDLTRRPEIEKSGSYG